METIDETAASEQRKSRFRELIYRALEVQGVGGQRVSQRRLAEVMALAPGMIRRYIDGDTEVLSLKYVTLINLAKATRLQVGTVFTWIEEGREAALEQEARRHGSLPPYTALDLAKHLVEMLSEPGSEDDDGRADAPPPPGPDLEPLRQRVENLEAAAGPMFERMLRLTGSEAAATKVLGGLQDPAELEHQDWEALALLLETELDALKGLCHLRPAVSG